MTAPLNIRFWQKVVKTTEAECWLWIGALTTCGYGEIWFNGKMLRSHRVSWLLAHGAVPERAQVLHKCDVRACVNPAHLFLGTIQDNIDDKVAKGREAKGAKTALLGSLHSQAKLTEAVVLEIRRLAPTMTQTALAKRFGVACTTIWYIVNRRTWTHI